jgi:DNA-directed RNA polymerase subunit beta'
MTNNNKQITLENIEKIILKVASPERILDNSFGEVLKSETINYRTQKPEKDGLFCEKIFGPKVDINIHDNKFKGVRTKELAVDKQGRIVTKSSSRRERMGHVKLQVPVTHTWFLRTNPSPIGYAVNMSVKTLERVVYFSAYLITKIDEAKKAALKDDLEAWFENEKKVLADKFEQMASSEEKSLKEVAKQRTTELEQLNNEYLQRKIQLGGLNYKAVLTEDDYANLPDEYQDIITVGMGAETVHEILKNTDLEKVIADLKEEADNASGQRYKKLLKRMKILEGIHQAGIKPEWFCLTVLPVIPPELRPMVQLSGGRFATSDLNDLYRRVINRNNRLKKLMSLGAPSLICRNEMRMLQEAVDSVLDNTGARGNRAVTATGGRRKLKSLTDVLKGKQGRLRGNLLGKRVDYSGRSVIVAGPDLKLDECGLPKIMALELFKPHVIGWLIANEHATNMRGATRLIELAEDVVWDALDSVIAGKRVLLNRAPTLHRLSILSFKPRLIEGRAIQLHPLVCAGFNADYNGDQMAVHLPISEEAQAEARDIMSPEQNLLKPADGSPILHITQDIVLGAYWLTHQKEEHKKLKTRDFSSGTEVEMAYECGDLTVHSPIRLKIAGERVETTYGRLLFNDVLPRGFK